MEFSCPSHLPIAPYCDEISSLLKKHPVLIVAGETGCGKTTQLPKLCLTNHLDTSGIIGCTQPRRVAAASVAIRVSQELGKYGHLVGHKVRFHDKTTPHTRIKFMTDGILLAETRQDRMLQNYSTIIVDEAHERSLNIDFLLGYLTRLLKKREDLSVIITSATIDTKRFSSHFNDAPVVLIEGRSYPIDIRYEPIPDDDDQNNYLDHCVGVVKHLIANEPPGDTLVFLPTENDIHLAGKMLSDLGPNHLVLPLYGRLPFKDQQRIFTHTNKTKIVIATNVAETSVTVPGIRYVIDSGLARISRYNHRQRIVSLPVSRISQSSCNQRAGRCGRVGPGLCLRLFSYEDFLDRDQFSLPEIQRANLAEVILQMIYLGLGKPAEFDFIDPPSTASIRSGYRLLEELDALNPMQKLTKTGSIMARLPVDPLISRILIEASRRDCLREITIIAAALAIQDPRVRPPAQTSEADNAHATWHHPHSDFLAYINLWDHCFSEMKPFSWSALKRFCKTHYLSVQRMREWIDLHDQLRMLLTKRFKYRLNTRAAPYDAIHQSLLTGLFMFSASRQKSSTYSATNSREVVIHPSSSQCKKGGDLIMAAHFLRTSQLFAHTVAKIEPQWLENVAERWCSYHWTNIQWDKKSGRVIADEQVSLRGLIFISGRRVNYPHRDPKNIDQARELFIREGLLAGKLYKPPAFLKSNMALVDSYREYEDKIRQKNIIIDDEAMFGFYHNRLPADVYDSATLHRYLKREGGKRLTMTEEDILGRIPDRSEFFDYPDHLSYGNLTLPLSYHFEPGHPDDGVTVTIFVDLLDSVRDDFFEWLVPGLLVEKTLVILKGFPKRIRKQLVPLNHSAERLLDGMTPYQGNYYQQLAGRIFTLFKLGIQPDDWLRDIPDHLRMRFVIVDGTDKEITSGRDLGFLRKTMHGKNPHEQASIDKKAREIIDQAAEKIFTDYQFDHYPNHLCLRNEVGEITGMRYAALDLASGQQGVKLIYVDSREEADHLNDSGTLLLFRFCLKEVFVPLRKYAKIYLSGPSAKWLKQLSSQPTGLVDEVLIAVARNNFTTHRYPELSQKEFAEAVEKARAHNLYNKGKNLIDAILELARMREEAVSLIVRLSSKAKAIGADTGEMVEDFHSHLHEILPDDFFSIISSSAAQDMKRRLQALFLRIERGFANPAKDGQKRAIINPFISKLRSVSGTSATNRDECREHLQGFQEAIAELRIAVFSPEVKTKWKVSEKKLLNLWKEVQTQCTGRPEIGG